MSGSSNFVRVGLPKKGGYFYNAARASFGIHVFRRRKHAVHAGRVRERTSSRRSPGLAELPRAGLRTRARPLAGMAPSKQARLQSVQHRLSAQARAAVGGGARAPQPRYSTTADLRKLLTHDKERGGILPIRLLSARWLLTHFKQTGNETARLYSSTGSGSSASTRRRSCRARPQLEQVLAELEERTVKFMGKEWNREKKQSEEEEHEMHGTFYMSKVESGEWRSCHGEEGGCEQRRRAGGNRLPERAALSLTCGSTRRTPTRTPATCQTARAARDVRVWLYLRSVVPHLCVSLWARKAFVSRASHVRLTALH